MDMEVDLCLLLRVTLILSAAVVTQSQEECQLGGCFPATGDLLVGRQDRLKANSTCGMNGAERYCIVSFLDKDDKCFYCDSRYAVDSDTSNTNLHDTSHQVKYIVTSSPEERLKGWWQSENGIQDVTIQLDLEVEFIFTHLIMTFKTFRPKAMYVERSWNYGRTWSDYRYFAYDCKKSFPTVMRGPQKNIDDVICEERYSRVEPSTGGEVVMKVLDPVIVKYEDPYSLRVQNLLKLTNLRIHFKELHTFGDDVLGDSPEVNRKYYYSLYEMVVRGSCSCYGHASQCIPVKGTVSTVNMVHGNCDCKHFTTGRNCERCMDGYNDEPWRPAYKDQLNVCRKCECNGHTRKCHFDPAVYNATGHTSGGVCDDCQHNTAGRQCEQCKPLYYRDPFRDISDPYVCRPCDCDPAGSFGGGECETAGPAEAGRCICKHNVVGRRCDRCKDGHWNLLESNPNGCQSCKCDKRGTVEKDTCDQKTGVCRCKRNVRGLTCSQCLDGYWKLGATTEGCEPCGCDPGGSRNLTCDSITGQCSCRPHLMGRKCDKVRPGYHFANLDHTTYEAENAVPAETGTPFEVVRKIAGNGVKKTWTGDGYLKIKKGSVIDFTELRVPQTGDYNLVLRYDTLKAGSWSDVRVTVKKTYDDEMGGDGCPEDDRKVRYLYPVLSSYDKAKELDTKICFQKGTSYKVKIDFNTNDGGGDGTTLLDSLVLLPSTEDMDLFQTRSAEAYQRRDLYKRLKCRDFYLSPNKAAEAPDACNKLQFSISSIFHNGGLSCQCDPVGTKSNGSRGLTCKEAGGQCPCKPGVTGRKCERCEQGYFGFGRNGCTACACNTTGSTSEFCHETTGKCKCLPQIQGRKCDSCPEFHFGFPNCKKCECNSHSQICDPVNGQCLECRHNTAGRQCNVCADGYYGIATQGTDTDCQRCQCPGGSHGNQFSPTCVYSNGAGRCNACAEGYAGNQCEKCMDGYYGNPLQAGGSCKRCDCSGNVDPFADGKCDPVSGECFNCINNAAGVQCERCKPGYFGNAANQTCRRCVCNELGTDPTKRGLCDRETGQCPCLENIEGSSCDRCSPGYYNIATGTGCLQCNCHKEGSLEASCNQLDGQCKCRVGFGGRDCSQCENFSWGNPMKDTCKACACNPRGSVSLQCDRVSGKCQCKRDVTGDKCDMCAPRTSGVMPTCDSCHTCNDQWEDIVTSLEKNITNMLQFNSTINGTGISLYTAEVAALRRMLRRIESMFKQYTVDPNEVTSLVVDTRKLRTQFNEMEVKVDDISRVVQTTMTRTDDANDELDKLKLRIKDFEKTMKEFKVNITKAIEGNVDGALNSTLESLKRSRAADAKVTRLKPILVQSKRKRKKIKREIINGDPPFKKLDEDNNRIVDQINIDISDLERKLKELNRILCGGGCGECTSTGCDSCGTFTGCSGVKRAAVVSLKKAKRALRLLEDKKKNAGALVQAVEQVETQVNNTYFTSEQAVQMAIAIKKKATETKVKILVLIKDIEAFLNVRYRTPNETIALAKETLGLNISLTPAEVRELAEKIRAAVKNLTIVDKILSESKKDLDDALKLKEKALEAKRFAIEVMNKTQKVLDDLARTEELQKNTEGVIEDTTRVLNDARDIINQIKRKLDEADGKLNVLDGDVRNAEDENEVVKEEFRKNRGKLAEAEKKYVDAKTKAGGVTNAANDLKKKYNDTKEKLNDKAGDLDDIIRRINTLDEKAEESVGDVNKKLSILNDLKKRYSVNEKRTVDLSRELRLLTIKAVYARDRLKELSRCHATCNPAILEDICIDELKQVEENFRTKMNDFYRDYPSTRS